MVLAAGEGRRLRPLTEWMPKPMVPVAGRPLLEHTVRWLRRHDVTDLVINLHHQPEVVGAHFGDGSALGVHITYSYEPVLLGTAGAIDACRHRFAGKTFLIVYGDNLSTCNLTRLLTFHCDRQALATIAVHYREDVTQSGMVVLDSDDRVRRFQEKPPPVEVVGHWVSAGIIVAEPALLSYVPGGRPSDLARDVLPAALAAGQPLYGYRMSPETEHLWWVDTIGDYHCLLQLVAAGTIAL